jgi:hypothetical protein
MPWTPTYKIIKSRIIAANLLSYFATNQVDAILWAAGSALRPFQTISNSVANRTTPLYPAIGFVEDADAQGYTDDLIPAAYSVQFEVLVQNSDPSNAVIEARSYEAAIKSMIRNCPPATVAANSGADVNATVLESIETQFDEIKSNKMQNDFLQSFQIRAIYRLSTSAF